MDKKNSYQKCLFEALDILHKIEANTDLCVSYYYHGVNDNFNFSISVSKIKHLERIFSVNAKLSYVPPHFTCTIPIQDGLVKLKDFCKENNINLGAMK